MHLARFIRIAIPLVSKFDPLYLKSSFRKNEKKNATIAIIATKDIIMRKFFTIDTQQCLYLCIRVYNTQHNIPIQDTCIYEYLEYLQCFQIVKT